MCVGGVGGLAVVFELSGGFAYFSGASCGSKRVEGLFPFKHKRRNQRICMACSFG